MVRAGWTDRGSLEIQLVGDSNGKHVRDSLVAARRQANPIAAGRKGGRVPHVRPNRQSRSEWCPLRRPCKRVRKAVRPAAALTRVPPGYRHGRAAKRGGAYWRKEFELLCRFARRQRHRDHLAYGIGQPAFVRDRQAHLVAACCCVGMRRVLVRAGGAVPEVPGIGERVTVRVRARVRELHRLPSFGACG